MKYILLYNMESKMAGIEFIKQKKENISIIVQIAAVFAVLLSSFAVLFSVFQFEIAISNLWISSILAAGLGYGMIFIVQKKKITAFIIFPIYIVLFVLNWESVAPFANKFIVLWNAYYKTSYRKMAENDIETGAIMMLFLMQLFFALVISFVLLKNAYWYMAVIMIISVIVMDSTVGYMPSTISGLAWILSSFLYFVVYHQRGKKGDIVNLLKVFVILALLCIVALNLSPYLEDYKKNNKEYETMKQKLTDIQKFDVAKWFSGFIESNSNYADSGIGKGDLENAIEFKTTGKKELSIITSSKPKKTLYLRAFIGSRYVGGKKWAQSRSYDFSGLCSTQDEYKELVNQMFNRLDREKILQKQHIKIELLNASDEFGYSPYNSYIDDESVYLDTCAEGNGLKTHEYDYFDSEDIKNIDKTLDGFTERWYDYQTFVREKYTEIPIGLNKLEQRCAKINHSSIDVLARSIDEWFDEMMYMYKPGATTEGADFVEDFLFHRKKGFCVHFASAAALIYRMCGYPSRYVEGYIIHPSKFIERDDGTYQAVIGDYGAHAWCETFDDYKGWQVREHTKTYSGAYDVSQTRKPERETTTRYSQETTTQQRSIRQETTRSNEKKIPGGDSSKIHMPSNVITGIIFIIVCIFAGIVVFVIPQRVRRIGKIRKIKGRNSICSTYNEVCRICIFMGCDIKKLYAREAVDEMIKMFPQLSGEDWMWMYNKALKAAFSRERLNTEENRKMYQLYRRFRKAILSEMKGIKKFVFLFIKAM